MALSSGEDWDVEVSNGALRYTDAHGGLTLPMPALPGEHQVQNAGVALAALRQLLPAHAATEAVMGAALSRAVWRGRMQQLRSGPLVDAASAVGADVWLDGGHNADAGAAIARTLADGSHRPPRLICGFIRGKDVRGFLAPLADLGVISAMTVAIDGEPSSMSAEEVAAAYVTPCVLSLIAVALSYP